MLDNFSLISKGAQYLDIYASVSAISRLALINNQQTT
jgi:hypothetical protein